VWSADFGKIYRLRFGPSGRVVPGYLSEMAILFLSSRPGTLSGYCLDGRSLQNATFTLNKNRNGVKPFLTSNVSVSIAVKLPELQLSTFDAYFENWIPFHDNWLSTLYINNQPEWKSFSHSKIRIFWIGFVRVGWEGKYIIARLWRTREPLRSEEAYIHCIHTRPAISTTTFIDV
jgi:hypothetical protein